MLVLSPAGAVVVADPDPDPEELALEGATAETWMEETGSPEVSHALMYSGASGQ